MARSRHSGAVAAVVRSPADDLLAFGVGAPGYGARMRRETVDPFEVWIPETRRERARGLLGRDALGPHEALWLPRCRSIHTFGMRVTLDVVLLDADERPTDVVTLGPRRMLLPRRRVRHVVEVAQGRGGAFTRALDARTTPDGRGSGRPART